MKTLKLHEMVYADITYMSDCAEEIGLSDEAVAFINKTCDAKSQRYRNSVWYEVKATDEEITAIIDEVIMDVLDRIEEALEYEFMSKKERQDTYRMRRIFQKWIDENKITKSN